MGDSMRLAEVMGALSTATDQAMGQPVDYALQSCALALRLGELAGLNDAQLRDVYYQSLLRFIGCNAETYLLAAMFGDEIALRTEAAAVDSADQMAMLKLALRHLRAAHDGASPLAVVRGVVRGLLSIGNVDREILPGHCEVAQRLGARLGFTDGFVRGLGQLYARWDGKGVPRVRGEEIAIAVRVVVLAQDLVTFHRLGGVEAARRVARDRRARQYDPRLVDLFAADADRMFSDLGTSLRWSDLLAREPGGAVLLDDEGVDRTVEVLADFADIKSPWTLSHSRRVAEVAVAAARLRGLDADGQRLLRRAALVHDIGRVGISAGIWGCERALTESEWEKVRLHAYNTDRVLARGGLLGRLGAIASAAHERLDGSGYFRGVGGAALEPIARLLGAADVYAALIDRRPHRPAYSPDAAAALMRDEVRSGRLDGQAVADVLAAAGASFAPPVLPTAPSSGIPGRRAAGSAETRQVSLTAREVEVLRTLAQGHTNKEIARRLEVSPKTVDNQLQSIYQKAGVRTRAGATLFAMEMRIV